MEWFTLYSSPCGRPEKVCFVYSSLISSKKNWFSSEKNCCYSFLSSSKKKSEILYKLINIGINVAKVWSEIILGVQLYIHYVIFMCKI